MSKTTLAILVILGVSVVAGVFGASFLLQRKTIDNSQASSRSNLTTLPQQNIPTPVPGAVSQQVYQDASGFSFRYPLTFKVYEESANLGPSYYSYLTLESNAAYGYFTVADTAYKSVDEYLFKDKDIKGATLVGASNLDGVAAKQYEKDGKLYTVAYDSSVIYVLQTPKDAADWDSAHDTIIESFKFVNPYATAAPVANTSTSTSSGPAAGGNVIYEPEETIQ